MSLLSSLEIIASVPRANRFTASPAKNQYSFLFNRQVAGRQNRQVCWLIQTALPSRTRNERRLSPEPTERVPNNTVPGT
jgi:hypothetical protein